MNTTVFHPMMVHFPIALLLVGFLFSTAAFIQLKLSKERPEKPHAIFWTGYWLLCIGTLTAIGSVFTGIIFTTAMEGLMGDLRTTHAILAICTLLLSLLALLAYTFSIFKRKGDLLWENLAYFLYVLTAIFVAVTGHFGGLLAYGF